MVQAASRRQLGVSALKGARRAALKIQTACRGRCARLWLSTARFSAERLQAIGRSRFQRHIFLRQCGAAKRLQQRMRLYM
eukprot:184104-Prymnesium_polylepis.2